MPANDWRPWSRRRVGREESPRLLERKALQQPGTALAPSLHSAYYLPDLAQLRNPRHLKALVLAFTRSASNYGRAVRFTASARGRRIQASQRRWVPVACRALSLGDRRLDGCAPANQLGWKPCIPDRGQIAFAAGHVAPTFVACCMQGKRFWFLDPNGRVLSREPRKTRAFDKNTTATAINDLLPSASRWRQSGPAALERSWAGLRPRQSDACHISWRARTATTCSSRRSFPGRIQLSPVTELVMKELLLGQPPSISLDPFRLDRQSSPPCRVAFRS